MSCLPLLAVTIAPVAIAIVALMLKVSRYSHKTFRPGINGTVTTEDAQVQLKGLCGDFKRCFGAGSKLL